MCLETFRHADVIIRFCYELFYFLIFNILFELSTERNKVFSVFFFLRLCYVIQICIQLYNLGDVINDKPEVTSCSRHHFLNN